MNINHTSAENVHTQNTKYANVSKKEKTAEQAEVAGQVKKDSVEISREGRMAAVQRMEVDENFLKNITPNKSGELPFKEEDIPMWSPSPPLTPSSALDMNFKRAEDYLYYVLNGKVGDSWKDAWEVANQLGSMIFHSYKTDNVDNIPDGKTYIALREGNETSRAVDREAGRNLAEYIAKTYFDDPKEAQAFMDKINKYLKNDELQDLGWIVRSPDAEPIDWLEQSKETSRKLAEHNKSLGYENDGYSEKGKELLAIHDEYVKTLKEIFKNAKLITDFSGNEKWNIVMNLLV